MCSPAAGGPPAGPSLTLSRFRSCGVGVVPQTSHRPAQSRSFSHLSVTLATPRCAWQKQRCLSQVPGSRIQAPGSKLQPSGYRFQALFIAPAFKALSSIFIPPGSRPQVLDSQLYFHNPGSRLQVPDSQLYFHNSRFQITIYSLLVTGSRLCS